MGSIQSKPRAAYDHARRRPKTRILGVTACDEATAFRDDGRVVAIVAHSSSHAPHPAGGLDELPDTKGLAARVRISTYRANSNHS